MTKNRKLTRLQFERMLGGNWIPEESDRYRASDIWITEVSKQGKILIHRKTQKKFRARTWAQIAKMIRPELVNKGEKGE